MSRENVEVVKAGFAAWNAGDMQALRDLYDPDAVVYHLEGWPEPGPSVGREAVMRQWESQRANLEVDAVEAVSDFIEAGGRVLVRVSWGGTSHGPDFEVEMTAIYTVRKGKILVTEHFWDHAEALEAVGLSDEAMSQGTVELAHRFYDAVNRRDLDAWLAVTDEDAELISILVSVEGGYHGHAGFRRWWENVFDNFPDYKIDVGEVRDLGDHRTLAAIRLRGHGAGSNVPIDQSLSQIIEWRQAKAVRVESFRSEAEALEAAGLRG